MSKFKLEMSYWLAGLIGLLILIQLFTMASVEKHYHNQRMLGAFTVPFNGWFQHFFGIVVMLGMAVVMLHALRTGADWLFLLISILAIVVGLLFRLDLPQPQQALDYPIVGGLVFGLVIKVFQPDGWFDRLFGEGPS